jgi:hypothetical protein
VAPRGTNLNTAHRHTIRMERRAAARSPLQRPSPDSILAAHSISAKQLKALMLKIIASAEYGRRTTR